MNEHAFAGVSLHLVDDSGLLLDAAGRRLFALNPCATAIWSLLLEGHPPADAARLLIDEFSVPPELAPGYVVDVLRQHQALCDLAEAPSDWPSTPPGTETVGGTDSSCYSLLGAVLRVHYGTRALFERIHPLLAHNAVTAGEQEAAEITVTDKAGEVVIASGRRLMGVTPTADTAAVAVRASLTELAVGRSGGFCAVHAGGLSRGGRVLLLPGDAGHGKSTLSGGLAAHGFEMVSDDTTLLSGDQLEARTMSTGLCIKRGAYPVLQPLYPRLASLPEWSRPDGRHARYLVPGIDIAWAPMDSAFPVRWIVFPRYHPTNDTRLEVLPRHEALARLLRGVYCLSGTLDGPALDRLIAWIEGIDCYELPLSSLEAATVLLEELCR